MKFDFEGLLGNPLFQAGMGILSANAPSLTPPNYMGGAMKGLMQGAQYAQQQKEMEMKKKLYDLQLQEAEDKRKANLANMTYLANMPTNNLTPEQEQTVGVIHPDLYDKPASREKMGAYMIKNAPTMEGKLKGYELMQPEKLSAFREKIQLSGLDPNNPEHTKDIKDLAFKSGVEINLPSDKQLLKTSDLKNYRKWDDVRKEWVYPEKIDTPENFHKQGFVFTPDSQISFELDNAKILKEKSLVLDDVRGKVKNYKETLLDKGIKVLPSGERMIVEGSYRDLGMAMKDYYKLGVIAGPDEKFMEGVIANPTTFLSAYVARNGIDAFLEQVDQFEKALDTTQFVIDQTYGPRGPDGKVVKKDGSGEIVVTSSGKKLRID